MFICPGYIPPHRVPDSDGPAPAGCRPKLLKVNMTAPDNRRLRDRLSDPLSRAHQLEDIVDRLDEKIAREREAEGVPGRRSEREHAGVRGSLNEPPD
jgi:hypothetical protein